MTIEPVKNAIPPEQLRPDDDKYLKGRQNWMIRMYFYLRQGMNMLNDFHNVFLGMITLALTFKVTSLLIITGITLPSLVLLIFVGYYNVHKFSKMSEWLSMRFGTHYSIKAFNFSQGTYEMLVEIRDSLKRLEKNR